MWYCIPHKHVQNVPVFLQGFFIIFFTFISSLFRTTTTSCISSSSLFESITSKNLLTILKTTIQLEEKSWKCYIYKQNSTILLFFLSSIFTFPFFGNDILIGNDIAWSYLLCIIVCFILSS